MKRFVIILLLLVYQARASLPVIDVSAIAHQILSYIKQAEQYVKEAEIDINTQLSALRELQILENSVLELLRMGDPRAIINLPGVSNIRTLIAIYQQAQADVEHVAQLANPQNAIVDAQNILGLYKQNFPAWTFKVPAAQGLFQFDASNYNTVSTMQDRITQLTQTKATLSQERDQAIASEAAATDTETRTRFHNQVASLSAAISDTNASIDQAMKTEQLQVQQNNAARQLASSAQTIQQAGNFGSDVVTGLDSINQYAPNDTVVPQWRGQ
jgi:hypothetical protein